MPVRVTQVPQNNTEGENTDPIGYTTEFDGQAFFWAPGQMRSIEDTQATGQLASAVDGAPAAGVVEDGVASKKRFPNAESRS